MKSDNSQGIFHKAGYSKWDTKNSNIKKTQVLVKQPCSPAQGRVPKLVRASFLARSVEVYMNT